jgi:hyperosmotically inducible periplasmic protein
MRKNLFYSLLLAISTLALFGCSHDREVADNKPAAVKVTDSDIENKIRAKYDADAAIKAADLDIDADADGNKVTLSGTVESQALRTRAVEMAKAAHTNVVVTDKIDVKPREVARTEYTEDMARTERERAKESGDEVGTSLDDAWIHTKVATKLMADERTPQNKINVDVNNNVVTLRGTVETAEQKAAAEQVARATEGVKSVKNMLKVGAKP